MSGWIFSVPVQMVGDTLIVFGVEHGKVGSVEIGRARYVKEPVTVRRTHLMDGSWYDEEVGNGRES